MSRRDLKEKYPPKVAGESCHHPAYNYAWYIGELAHRRYQHNEAMLLPVKNERHNQGPLALHSLIKTPPPMPRYTLMADCVDFMESLDPEESRIRRFGHVISFYMDVAEDEISTFTADQARSIAEHYTAQWRIIVHCGFVSGVMYIFLPCVVSCDIRHIF